jgi:hypothetical protein
MRYFLWQFCEDAIRDRRGANHRRGANLCARGRKRDAAEQVQV